MRGSRPLLSHVWVNPRHNSNILRAHLRHNSHISRVHLRLLKAAPVLFRSQALHTSSCCHESIAPAPSGASNSTSAALSVSPRHVKNLVEQGKLDSVTVQHIFQNLQDNSSLIPCLQIIRNHDKSLIDKKSKKIIISALAKSRSPEAAHWSSIIFYQELQGLQQGSLQLHQADIEHLCIHFLRSAQFSNDLVFLLNLKYLYQNYITTFSKDPMLELHYLDAYINILFNTKNSQKAVRLFEESFRLLISSSDALANEPRFDPLLVLQVLPFTRVLDTLCSSHDYEGLIKWLRIMDTATSKSKTSTPLVTSESWMKYLSLGLTLAQYDLVKLVYDKFIMKGYDGGISQYDALFDPSMSNVVFEQNKVLNSMSEQSVFDILHIFALNGDVQSTLQLIESHYVHKTLKGEKALTLELCTQIIAAYCYHTGTAVDQDGESDEPITKDNNVERVLTVINQFVTKFNSRKAQEPALETLSYKDISVYMSHRFLEYKIRDRNVKSARKHRRAVEDKILNSDENQLEQGSVKPRKVSNENVHSHVKGNILANLEILEKFIARHIEFMLAEKHHIDTVTLFINCILNHINLRQNFSGLVRALLVLKSINGRFQSEWLDNDSYNILLNSLSKSTASKMTSLKLFQHLSQSRERLTHRQFVYLVSASLRGENYHDLLEYYVYQYLVEYKGIIDPELLIELETMKGDSSRFDSLYDFVKSHCTILAQDAACHENSAVLEEYEFNTKPPSSFANEDSSSSTKRRYNRKYDIIDCEQLEYALTGQS